MPLRGWLRVSRPGVRAQGASRVAPTGSSSPESWLMREVSNVDVSVVSSVCLTKMSIEASVAMPSASMTATISDQLPAGSSIVADMLSDPVVI